jgi:arylsulfatase
MLPERPNIILIMTDQQRFDTLAAWGYDHMITPHMDRIVREGLSFRQAYCPGATCIASRAAISLAISADRNATINYAGPAMAMRASTAAGAICAASR